MKKTLYFLFTLSIVLSACKTEPKKDTSAEVPEKMVSSTEAIKPTTVPKSTGGINDDLLTLSKIYLQYKNNGKVNAEKVNAELAQVNNPDLDFIKAFVYECTQQSPNLLSLKFMRKPAKEDLQRIFQLRRINWNSMSMEGVTTAVIDTFDINSVNNEELLTAYYRLVIDGIQPYKPSKTDYSRYYLDFDQLHLENNQEKAIAFYSTVDGFAQRYNSFIRNNDKCEKARELVATFPKVNGKALLEATPPSFEDFKVTVANNAVDKSFKAYFVKAFEQARGHYLKCKS